MSIKNIDSLIREAVFGADEETRQNYRKQIRNLAIEKGIRPASIQNLYMAAGKGAYHGITVPAINIRGIAYDVACAVFRSILKSEAWACIFEIARSEMDYTRQSPDEYATVVMAAALKEGYTGPVFIQVDHLQAKSKVYKQNPETELDAMKAIIRDAVKAGFYNIDIDASTLVDISKPTLEEQQELNSRVTAEMTRFIRSIEPKGITISIGGEIGEIGKGNSTVEELRAFMETYQDYLTSDVTGISKISVQTGTTHGGVVLPDGSIADVSIDFDTLKKLGEVARREYGLGGAVQHGASTLPDNAFDMFPKVDTLEVHLATGFQNIIYDSENFPADLRETIRRDILQRYAGERKPDESEEQFIYKTRKKSLGDFKRQLWDIPEPNKNAIMKELEDRFDLIFQKLNCIHTRELVQKYIK